MALAVQHETFHGLSKESTILIDQLIYKDLFLLATMHVLLCDGGGSFLSDD